MSRNPRAVTTTITAVGAIVALIIGLSVGFVSGPVLTPAQTVTVPRTVVQTALQTVTAVRTEVKETGLTGEVEIGAVMTLSGDLQTYGENSKKAVEIAAAEVNDFLKKTGAKWTLKMVYEDDKTSPPTSLEKVQSLNARGIKIMLGGMFSGAVRNVKGYVDAQKILFISPSSTAPDLNIKDSIYRFVPDDNLQGKGIARVMYDDGIRYLIQTWRKDAWGEGLAKTTKDFFTKLGGQVVGEVGYPDTAKDFSLEVKTIADLVKAQVDQGRAAQTAVVIDAFGEIVQFFTQAGDHAVLKQVRWYGSDGTALEAALLAPGAAKAAQFSVDTKFLNPIYGEPSAKRALLRAQLEKALGRIPDSYSYSSYDIIWMLALSLMAVDRYDAAAVEQAMHGLFPTYKGAIGSIVLNPGGDLEKSDYELWVIKKVADKFQWVQVGIWDFESDTASYTL